MIEVIEVDQHSSTADQFNEWDFEQMKKVINGCSVNEVPKLSGGDAEAAQSIYGGNYEVKKVNKDDEPGWGMVWFKEGENGELKRYKYNFATK